MIRIRNWFVPAEITIGCYALRLLLVVIQILLAYCLAGQTDPFFYQAF